MSRATSLLIGGYALRKLGSSRYTKNTDYLIYEPESSEWFISDTVHQVNYVNASVHPFFDAVWASETNNTTGQASAQALLELNAFAFVQYDENHHFQKLDDAIFDIRFLVRNMGATALKLVAPFITLSQLNDVNHVILTTRR